MEAIGLPGVGGGLGAHHEGDESAGRTVVRAWPAGVAVGSELVTPLPDVETTAGPIGSYHRRRRAFLVQTPGPEAGIPGLAGESEAQQVQWFVSECSLI